MIELVDVSTLQTIGFKYEDDERAAATFATSLYAGQLVAGNIVDDPNVLQQGLQVADEIDRTLNDGLDTVPLPVHSVLSSLILPFTARLHEYQWPRSNYSALCNYLGIKAFDLFTHAVTARQIINEERKHIALVMFD